MCIASFGNVKNMLYMLCFYFIWYTARNVMLSWRALQSVPLRSCVQLSQPVLGGCCNCFMSFPVVAIMVVYKKYSDINIKGRYSFTAVWMPTVLYVHTAPPSLTAEVVNIHNADQCFRRDARNQ